MSAQYTLHPYPYREGGALEAARALRVPPREMVKTLVMETDRGEAFLLLMPGDRRVSLKRLARALGVKNVSTVAPREAERLTGYRVGGISPYGTKRPLPVYVDKSILQLDRLYVNGGRRGLVVELTPRTLLETLRPTPVHAAG